MKAKILIAEWFAIVVISLCLCSVFVYRIDPYFHYHKPDTEGYFYRLDNERYQNDGITRHFDYDALITGSSMTLNFKTTEFDKIFGVNSIKVSYGGGSYKEVNDNLIVALEHNSQLKTIVRGLDMYFFTDSADYMNTDVIYPTYLYNNNPLDDFNYLLNKDVLFSRIYPMVEENNDPNAPRGITSFDDYARWGDKSAFGIDTIVPDRNMSSSQAPQIPLPEEVRKNIHDNITQNVTSLADRYPDVDFYYFITPYSIAWWEWLLNDGVIDWQVAAEQYVIELILEHPNIHLYSFNNRTEITTDLNNYIDEAHYGEWINTLILKWMHDGEGLLTKENYEAYLEEEYEFYSNYDYESANKQEDYEADLHAAALMNQEINGVIPEDLLQSEGAEISLQGAQLQQNIYENQSEILCTGKLSREPESDVYVSDYVKNVAYIGARIRINDIGKHRFLEFYGKKESDQGQPAVYVYDSNNEMIAYLKKSYEEIDDEWHQYVIELPEMEGNATIIINGGYIDNSGSEDSSYRFKNVTLY